MRIITHNAAAKWIAYTIELDSAERVENWCKVNLDANWVIDNGEPIVEGWAFHHLYTIHFESLVDLDVFYLRWI